MDHGALAAQGTAPPKDGEQSVESPEPPPPWPPLQPPPPPAPPPPAPPPPVSLPLHAPSPELAPQFCPEPAPESRPKATLEPATEPNTEKIPEPDTEPAPEPTPEPATEPDTQPISEPATEPALKLAPKPATDLASELAPEPAPEPATESCAELVPESCPELRIALRLLQCPVVAPETGLKALSSPQAPVPLPSIKVRKRPLGVVRGESQARPEVYRDRGTLSTLSIPFGCHQLAKMLKKMRGWGAQGSGRRKATCGSESGLFKARNGGGGRQHGVGIGTDFSPWGEETVP